MRAPEVVQTSAMDCGPACLTSMLEGHGVTASYERLREACQTDIDGTSIDAIEEAAKELGLDAEQILVPADHVLRPYAHALPAIAVTRLPSGDTHFIVIWRIAGSRVQLMDPAIGRRWVAKAQLQDDLYVHTAQVPAAAWREWAGSDDMRGPLSQRLSALGAANSDALIDRALADRSWKAIAALDASVRLVQRIIDARGVARGVDALRIMESLISDPRMIPDDVWSARPTDDPDTIAVRGAVLVRVKGRSSAAVQPTSVELRAALEEKPVKPWTHMIDAVLRGGWRPILIALAAIVTTATMFVVQGALWRSLFDTDQLTTMQIAGALVMFVVFNAIYLLTERTLQRIIARLGRRLELDLRSRFLSSITRLGLSYLGSRPISDMAGRSHALHRLNEPPLIVQRLIRQSLFGIITAAALMWLAPEGKLIVLGLLLVTIAPPIFTHRALTERELRARIHQGALSTFYLDSLLGTSPVMAHGAERSLRREHEARLVEWVRAANREHGLASGISAIQSFLVAIFSIALVANHAHVTNRPASVLLLVFWTLQMPGHAMNMSSDIRSLTGYRNLVLRLLEPLASIGQIVAPRPIGKGVLGPGPIVFDHVSVVAGGHRILDNLSVTIDQGQHVAIVGRSGAGKTSMLGVLLGWHRPAEGMISVGGAWLDDSTIDQLRHPTAWVDPAAVQLWNDSLASNLAFGAPHDSDLGAAVIAAQLDGVLVRLPEGMKTQLGEGGGLVSGGEGQRVRFGRAYLRGQAELVLLDEPFRGLDRDRRRELLATAHAHWRGVTMLCATHDIAETQIFDRVLVIDGGNIVEDGNPRELAASPGSRYRALIAEEVATAAQWQTWRGVRLDGGKVVQP